MVICGSSRRSLENPARGTRVVSLLPLGPPIEGAGLNVTVMSYLDRMDWGFIACRELAPRLAELAHAV